MEVVDTIISFVLHIDTHLGEIISNYGAWAYGILFAIVFAETGLVFTPFLPGDSLLFAAGAFAALGSFSIMPLIMLLWLAAFLGDTANYWIGHFFGEKIIKNPKIPINQEHIDKTQAFFEKHGGKAIVLARFIPIIRTFAPFVAGISRMHYGNFITYNAIGGAIWVALFTLAGFFFGNLKTVKDHFEVVVFTIIGLSILPIIVEYIKHRRKGRQ